VNTGIRGISIIMILSSLFAATSAAEVYEVEFSTYVGGNGYEHIRDICADKQGNVYITGGTTSPDYPTTPGAYQRTHGGMFDIFVTKFSPTGNIVWSTLVGGKDYDRAYAIEVDDQGYVYVGGRGGRDAPITSGVVQETFKGQWAGGPCKSDMNAYIFKLSPDGSRLIWATYFGTGQKGAVVKLSADFTRLLYSAYMNGSKRDDLRASFLGEDGNWYVGGESGSVDWPIKDAFQESFAGQGDCIVARLKPAIAETMEKNTKYEVAFSTYLGGSRGEDTARAVAVDREGYIYVTGGTQSPDFPVTDGALDTTFATGGTSLGSRGAMNVFVTKLDPSGSIVWSTYLGGPNYDRAYSVRVDEAGNVYIAGRAGDGFPTTPGVIQEKFAGDSNPPGAYGKQDGFITKLSPDGSEILWSTYFGDSGGSIIRDIDIDDNRNVYITLMGVSVPSQYITSGAFQTELSGGRDNVIAKLSSDGSHVIWASYLGGSRNDIVPSIRVDADGYVYVDGSTTSADFPVTENAYQTVQAGSEDAFVAKFRPDGSGLEYATFLGGSQSDGAAGKHGLAIDKMGHVYVVGFTSSSDFPTTAGAFQTRYAGGMKGNWEQTGDRFIAKISPNGNRLLASTFVGGDQRDGGEGIAVDDQGRVYLSSFTYSNDFPVNDDAMQRENAELPDGVAFILSADFSYAELSTYMGGSGNDNFRACAVGTDGSFVIVGSTNSRDWPVRNAMQPTFGGGNDDVIVVRFSPKNP
jgi:hypothetical protein